jgi:transcriptional regulator with XRE-family HTH domain
LQLLFAKGGDFLKDKWTGRLIGKMHNHEITRNELANELGVKKSYVSMILNCDRKPPDAQQRLEAAVDAIIERRKA